MSDRSKLINRLINEQGYRAAYIRGKLDVLIPSQLRALRLRDDLTQPDLAARCGMKQSRISAMETPGRTNFSLETLVRMAATFKVGLQVRFVPFSEMLRWENSFNQDRFNPLIVDNDMSFRHPASANFSTFIFTGNAYSVPMRLTGNMIVDSIPTQSGHADLHFAAGTANPASNLQQSVAA